MRLVSGRFHRRLRFLIFRPSANMWRPLVTVFGFVRIVLGVWVYVFVGVSVPPKVCCDFVFFKFVPFVCCLLCVFDVVG